jgi:hypothetical protein
VSGGSRGPPSGPRGRRPPSWSSWRRGPTSPDPHREAREEELVGGSPAAAAASELPSLGMEPRLREASGVLRRRSRGTRGTRAAAPIAPSTTRAAGAGAGAVADHRRARRRIRGSRAASSSSLGLAVPPLLLPSSRAASSSSLGAGAPGRRVGAGLGRRGRLAREKGGRC